jgi:hypothetical protein
VRLHDQRDCTGRVHVHAWKKRDDSEKRESMEEDLGMLTEVLEYQRKERDSKEKDLAVNLVAKSDFCCCQKQTGRHSKAACLKTLALRSLLRLFAASLVLVFAAATRRHSTSPLPCSRK